MLVSSSWESNWPQNAKKEIVGWMNTPRNDLCLFSADRPTATVLPHIVSASPRIQRNNQIIDQLRAQDHPSVFRVFNGQLFFLDRSVVMCLGTLMIWSFSLFWDWTSPLETRFRQASFLFSLCSLSPPLSFSSSLSLAIVAYRCVIPLIWTKERESNVHPFSSFPSFAVSLASGNHDLHFLLSFIVPPLFCALSFFSQLRAFLQSHLAAGNIPPKFIPNIEKGNRDLHFRFSLIFPFLLCSLCL